LAEKALTCGIQEYGRLNKTIFILRYLLTEQVQRRIGAQTNKGEALHALRGFLFLANEGRIRRRYYEEQLTGLQMSHGRLQASDTQGCRRRPNDPLRRSLFINLQKVEQSRAC
jgi:hypothetical protein